MKNITINEVQYRVDLELNKWLKKYKDCSETFSMLMQLGLMNGKLIKL